MKNKAIISLILITVVALSTTIAYATSWNPSSGAGIGTSGNPQDGWQILAGGFAGMINTQEGVWGTAATYSNAAHPINVSSTGNFSLAISFKLQGLNTTAFVGISTNSNPSTQTNGWMVIGNTKNGTFRVSSTGTDILGGRALGNAIATPGSYTAHIVSTDSGKTATFSIDGYGTPLSISLPATPKFIIVHLNNANINLNNITPSTGVPVLTGISFVSVDPTPTVSPSPTATPQPAQAALDLNAIREFYASQPATHMSDANAVRNADGTYSIPNGMGQVKYGLTGMVTSATGNTPIVGAT